MRRVVVVALACALAGCSGAAGDAAPGVAETAPTGPGEPGVTGTLTIFAAASLTEVFTGFGDRLEEQHPQLEVRFNFAGSSALATQITQGAPADVFAPADEAQMAVVTDAGLAADDPVVVAENALVIAVPAGNPAGVTGLADLADADNVVALCAPEVPCGAAAERVFDAAGLAAAPDTLEEDVKAALTKVQLGEVDAALVYATDVRAAGSSVEGVEFVGADRAVNRYPVCTLAAAPNPVAARAFVDLVGSGAGRQALADAGFRTP